MNTLHPSSPTGDIVQVAQCKLPRSECVCNPALGVERPCGLHPQNTVLSPNRSGNQFRCAIACHLPNISRSWICQPGQTKHLLQASNSTNDHSFNSLNPKQHIQYVLTQDAITHFYTTGRQTWSIFFDWLTCFFSFFGCFGDLSYTTIPLNHPTVLV